MTAILAVTATRAIKIANASAVIGYRADGRPIFLHHGHDQWSTMFAEPDTGDDGDGADDEADDDDDEPGAATAPAYTPPSQEEWDRVQAAVKRNNAENKQHRLLKKALEARGIDVSTEDGQTALDDLLNGRTPADTSTGQQGQDANAAKRDAQRAAERAAAKVEAKYKPALARAAAQAALTSAGWSGTASELARALKMVDLDDVDVDADGNVTGIADQIAEIKADIPSWFKAGEKAPAGERRRGAAEVDGGDRATKAGAGAENWLTRVDAQITGNAR